MAVECIGEPPPSDERPSTQLNIQEFADVLETRGVNVTVRDTRGQDIDAACGQLGLVPGISRGSM